MRVHQLEVHRAASIKLDFSRQLVQGQLWRTYNDAIRVGDRSNALRALELLGKTCDAFSENLNISVSRIQELTAVELAEADRLAREALAGRGVPALGPGEVVEVSWPDQGQPAGLLVDSAGAPIAMESNVDAGAVGGHLVTRDISGPKTVDFAGNGQETQESTTTQEGARDDLDTRGRAGTERSDVDAATVGSNESVTEVLQPCCTPVEGHMGGSPSHNPEPNGPEKAESGPPLPPNPPGDDDVIIDSPVQLASAFMEPVPCQEGG